MAWNPLERTDHSSRSMYINLPAIGIFLAVAAALAGGVHVLHLWQVARHTPLVLAEAQKRAEAGDHVAALAYYQTYLGYRSDDVEAIAAWALLKAKTAKNVNSAADAFYALMQALPKVPDRDDLRRELVALAVKLGRIRDCEEDLGMLLDRSPDDPDVLTMAARGAVQLRQFDVARVRYERLLDQGIDAPEVYQELLRLLSVEIKDHEAADDVLARLLKRHPNSSDIRVMAGAYYFRRGLLAQADEQISVAINELQATDPALYRLQAEIARQRRKPREFEARLAEVASQSEGDLSVEFQMAEIDLASGRLQPARERLLKISRNEQATAEQVWRTIVLLDNAKLLDDEAELRQRLNTLDVGEKYGPSMAMRDRMREQKWKSALELSRGLLRQTDVSPMFIITLSMWRAECYGQLGDIAEQINCYRRAIDVNESYQPARIRLAQLLFRSGQFTEARGEYATLMQQAPEFAREFVSELLLAQSPEAKSPMSAVEVDRLFARWRESAPSDPMPVLCELDLLQRKKDVDKAARLASEGMKRWPQEIRFRLAQLDGLLRDKNWQAAWTALDEAELACGMQPALLVGRILCLDGLAPKDHAAQLIAFTNQFSQFDRDGQAQVWPILIRSLQRAGVDPQAVEDLLNEYGEKNPGDGLARLVRFQNAVSTGDLKTAREHLNELRNILGETSPSYRFASIIYDVKAAASGDNDALLRATQNVEAIRAALPTVTPQFLTLQAELDLLHQRPQDALSRLKEAMALGDVRVSTLTRILALMVVSSQLDQTVPYLKDLAKSAKPGGPTEASEAPKSAVGLLPANRDLAALRPILAAAAPKSWPLALVTYRVDLEMQQPDQGEVMLRMALKNSSNIPLVWSCWLEYLERYHPEQLDQALADIENYLPLTDRAKLLPAVLLRLKRHATAVALLQEATSAAPQDPVLFRTYVRLLREMPPEKDSTAPRVDVEEILKSAMARTDEPSAPVREMARRELARWKSVSRNYQVYREAVALAADIVQQASPGDEEAWMIQAEVNSTHFAHWKDALAAYRQLEGSPRIEVRAEALSQKARLHEQHQRWEDQAAALAALNELTPHQPQVVSQLLLNAVRRKDAAQAQSLSEELSTLVSDDRQQLLCDVLRSSLSEDRTEVVLKVRAALEKKQIKPETAIEWLSLLKADQDCEEILRRQLASQQPAATARYILFLSSHDRVSDAVQHLSQLWKSGARDLAGAVATAMTASPGVTPDDLADIRSALLKLTEQDDAALPLLAAAAALEDHAGRHAEAMALHRRILTQAPDNVVSLNNLSFLEAISEASPGDETLQRIRRAIEIFGPSDQFVDTEGVVLLRQGDAQGAQERFQQAWELRPEPNYLVHLGWALTNLGQLEAAAEAFRKAESTESRAKLHPLEIPLDEAWRQQLLDKQNAPATTTN